MGGGRERVPVRKVTLLTLRALPAPPSPHPYRIQNTDAHVQKITMYFLKMSLAAPKKSRFTAPLFPIDLVMDVARIKIIKSRAI